MASLTIKGTCWRSPVAVEWKQLWTPLWLSTFRDTRIKSINSLTEFKWILWVIKERSTGECWEHFWMILNCNIWFSPNEELSSYCVCTELIKETVFPWMWKCKCITGFCFFFSPRIQAYLRDSLGLVLYHHNEVNISIKQIPGTIWFPSAHKNYVYVIL